MRTQNDCKNKIVAIIIINYCGLEDTIACVTSLFDMDNPNWEAFLIDNASPDGSGVILERCYAGNNRVHITLLKENVGFGAGNNIAIRQAISAGFDYIMLLNNDTVVMPDLLDALLPYTSERNVLSPLIRYFGEPRKIWFAGGHFDWLRVPRHDYQDWHVDDLSKSVREISYATGCCILFHKNAYYATQGFDERYFLYWEDADLSWRLSAAGFSLLFVPGASLLHKISASTGGENSPLSQYYGIRNRLYMTKKLNLGPRAYASTLLSIIKGLTFKRRRYSTIQAIIDYGNGIIGPK